MSVGGLEIFDTTIHETNRWLNVVMRELGVPDRRQAFTALRATLRVLRDRIGLENAVHLSAQLPMLLRGAFYEAWHPSRTPTRERRLEDFLVHIASELPSDQEIDPEAAARAALAALAECISPGEVEKIADLLPADIRVLLPRIDVSDSGN